MPPSSDESVLDWTGNEDVEAWNLRKDPVQLLLYGVDSSCRIFEFVFLISCNKIILINMFLIIFVCLSRNQGEKKRKFELHSKLSFLLSK